MTGGRMRVIGLLALVLAALLAGCGGGETKTVTSRVEIVRPVDGDGAEATATPAGELDAARVYRRASPGVVTVIAAGVGSGEPGRGDSGLGSGFVVSERGEIVTNAHVVTSGEGRSISRASRVYVRFADGNQVSATIRGFDPFADVALLEVDPAGLTLRPLPLGSAGDVKVGAPVAAIGSPFGEEQSLSTGVVSATDRAIQSLTGFDTIGAIQTDAAINHGNSGGPLLDASGRVLGINSQIQTTSGDGTGVGFAVPVDTVKRSLAQLRSRGTVRYAYLGISTVAVFPQLADEFDLGTDHGAWVQTVVADGPAAKAGVRAGSGRRRFQEREYVDGGDVLLSIDGAPIRKDSDVALALSKLAPGSTVELEVRRDGERRTVRVALGERPLDSRPGG